MNNPKRIQLSRRKGWNLQVASRIVNDLPAVNVSRPSKWGNPFKVGRDGNSTTCVQAFRELVRSNPIRMHQIRQELAGKNLACWCKPGNPCHADVLLEIANQ